MTRTHNHTPSSSVLMEKYGVQTQKSKIIEYASEAKKAYDSLGMY